MSLNFGTKCGNSAFIRFRVLMAKIKYYYDTETCRYERVRVSLLDVALNLAGLLIVACVIAVGLATLYNWLFPSERMAELLRQNRELMLKYELLDKELGEADQMLGKLQERDDKLYRVVFEADPIPNEVRKSGTGGSEKYKNIINERLDNESLILTALSKIDQLKRKMYIQTKSYDELSQLAKSKAQMLASIPAIQPLRKEQATFSSGFGYRVHPIYKIRKMHTGCDLSAPKGVPVYATGDGVVIAAGWDSGYGNAVEVNHGYGYVTRYAHLSAMNCRVGHKVKRGQVIGKVGSTGLSVSPHLHYEVLHNGKYVNPVNYFYQDLSPKEYQQMLEISNQDRQSLGGGH